MKVTFADGTDEDRESIAALHVEAADVLGHDFGDGPWARPLIPSRVGPVPGRSRTRVGRHAGAIVCALRLQRKRPWPIDVSYFTPVSLPLYLVDMVVSASFQRRGIGMAAIADASQIARQWPVDAVRLDAWATPAGAGPFYEKCGYANRGHAIYRGTPVVYYERLLAGPSAS